jgi:hypothetical protein
MIRFIADLRKEEIVVYSISNDFIKKCDSDELFFNSERLDNYLETAVKICILLDSTKSIFEDISITSNETFLSDGDWIWSGDLNYYSKHHHFLWPEKFLLSVINKSYELKELSNHKIEMLENIYLDIKKIIFKEDWTNGTTFFERLPQRKYEVLEL